MLAAVPPIAPRGTRARGRGDVVRADQQAPAERPARAVTARRLLTYLFAMRGKHRITAYCDSRNAASIALLERLAMRREGHLRESTWAKGEWTDDLVYALLHDEWQPG